LRKNIKTTQIPIIIAKQRTMIQLLNNPPFFIVMPDGKFLALAYKTERIIVRNIEDIIQIEFPTLPNTNSTGKPHHRYLEVGSFFQKSYWKTIINITAEMIPRIKGPSTVLIETYLRLLLKASRLWSWERLEWGKTEDRSLGRFAGNLLQLIISGYPRQKYSLPRVQFLGMLAFVSFWVAVTLEALFCSNDEPTLPRPNSCGSKTCGDRIVKLN
jgi:hypothetical protein